MSLRIILIFHAAAVALIHLTRQGQRKTIATNAKVKMSVVGDVEKSLDDGKHVVATDATQPEDWNDHLEKRNPKNWTLHQRIFHTIIPCLISFEVQVILTSIH